MARKTLIQIRRGLESALGTLAAGELGYCTDTGKLFIGSAGGNVLLASGQGTGDMLKSIYDTNNNGKVDYAQAADTVPWSGVDGKPSVYPAAAHTHDYLPKGPLTWNQLKGGVAVAYGESMYGVLTYSSEGGPQEGPEVHAPDLMKYLPEYYRGIPEMEALQASAGAACGEIAYAIADSDDQKTLDSATWGLARWERMLGLTTDTNKSYATRREMIKAKLRGSGTTTPEMIRRTASAFSGGDVEVVEVPGAYSFEVRFVGTLGIPANMAGLIQIMEEIKPAHLDYSFVYSYTWWDSLRSLTWGGAHGKTWNELRVYE